MKIVNYDFAGMLTHLTSISDWKEAEGPDTGVGVDYYYFGQNDDGNTFWAYVNVDQGEVSLSVKAESEDNETSWSASFDVEDKESEFSQFVRTEISSLKI